MALCLVATFAVSSSGVAYADELTWEGGIQISEFNYTFYLQDNRSLMVGLDDVRSAEVFLRIPIGSGDAQITPPIQHVENPGFDTSGSTFSSSALVAGVRFHWSFKK